MRSISGDGRTWVAPFLALAAAGALALAGACGGAPTGQQEDGGGPGEAGAADAAPDGSTMPDSPALLEVYALDLWAQPLPAAEAQLTITRDGTPAPMAGFPVAVVPLTEAGAYDVTLAAPQHETLAVTVQYDGSATLDGAWLEPPAGEVRAGRVLSHEERLVDGRLKPVHSAYLGLRHRWFSAEGRPARRGNRIELLLDGEEAWNRVHADLTAAERSILVSTWWWESNFELVRDPATHLYLTPEERWANTILGILETSPADKRVLVGQFWGQDGLISWITSDADLWAYGAAPNDGFEFMGQANPTEGQFWFEIPSFRFSDRVRVAFVETAGRTFAPEDPIASTVPPHQVDLTQWPVGLEVQHASYHQKFAVVDGDIAYVGGMNLRRVDWDTSDHLVFEPRRMLFDATTAAREAVADKQAEPDTGPRKDYMVRLEGPAAQDAADVFQRRWREALAEGVTYAENSTDFEVERDLAAAPDGLQVQVTATLPEPFWEHAIAETWFNAVGNATDYIYIEDQYFRIPMLVDAIAARMRAVPDLKLVVITKPINEWTDPGCPWTYRTSEQLAAEFPDRFLLLQLRAFDTAVTSGTSETGGYFADMDTHSKMLIVDDTFMSVGSANKNNRGLIYEAELCVAVADPAWVRAARRRILANLLPAGTPATDASAEWWDQLIQAAAWNDAVYANWEAAGWYLDLGGAPLPASYTPAGFVYSLEFRTVSDCFIESVGPDMV